MEMFLWYKQMRNNLCIQTSLASSINEPAKQEWGVSMFTCSHLWWEKRIHLEHAQYVGKNLGSQETQAHTLGTHGREILTLQVIFFMHSHLYLNMEHTTCTTQSIHWNLSCKQNPFIMQHNVQVHKTIENGDKLADSLSHAHISEELNVTFEIVVTTTDTDLTTLMHTFQKFLSISFWIGLLGVMLASNVCHFSPSIKLCSRIIITRHLPFRYMQKLPK